MQIHHNGSHSRMHFERVADVYIPLTHTVAEHILLFKIQILYNTAYNIPLRAICDIGFLNKKLIKLLCIISMAFQT